MPDALPPEIRTQITPTGMLYEMPPRDIGWLGYIAAGLMLLGMGLHGVSFYLALFASGILKWLTNPSGSPLAIPHLFNVIFALPCLLFGFFILRAGRFLSGGRSTIEIDGDRLIVIQGSGLLRRRHKLPINTISRFQVKTSNPERAPAGLNDMSGALNAVLHTSKTKNITWGYTRPLLRALADELAHRCMEQAGAYLTGDAPTRIDVEERTIGQDRLAEAFRRTKGALHDGVAIDHGVPTQPADTAIRLETRDDGLTLTIPPVGVRKGGKGLFGFALLWNGFMVIFTGFWLFGSGSIHTWDLPALIAFFAIFWGAGIGMMLGAVNAGRRMAILDVVGDTLLVTRKSIFKTTQQEVQRENIKAIQRDKSGVEVNDVPVLNLQVHLQQGKTIAMLSQLSNDELAWIAAVLREALDVPMN